MACAIGSFGMCFQTVALAICAHIFGAIENSSLCIIIIIISSIRSKIIQATFELWILVTVKNVGSRGAVTGSQATQLCTLQSYIRQFFAPMFPDMLLLLRRIKH